MYLHVTALLVLDALLKTNMNSHSRAIKSIVKKIRINQLLSHHGPNLNLNT